MFLKLGVVAVILMFITAGSAQNGPPGPPGVDDSRFPKFSHSAASAPGHHDVPEDLLIYPEIPVDRFVPGGPQNPEDPESLIDPGPEIHSFSDPRGPISYRVPFNRFFPRLDQEGDEYISRDVKDDMEP